MTKKLATHLKQKYKKMELLTQCLLLHFKNLLLIRTIKLKSLSLYHRVVIQDNEIEIFWNVKGCHKIKIEGIGVFAGNSHGIKFIFSNRHNPMEITFFGIAKKIKKRIRIENTKINLVDKFIVTTEIPILSEVPFNRHKFQSDLSEDKLKMELQNVYFEFEPFHIDNFKPLNTIQ